MQARQGMKTIDVIRVSTPETPPVLQSAAVVVLDFNHLTHRSVI
jgi:hypothetical protein